MSIRTTDLRCHLDDLRTRTHAGRQSWEDKAALFAEEVERLDPVVRQAMAELSETWLDAAGEIQRVDTEADPEGHLVTRWSLSWPDQREAGIEPVQVAARFAPGRLHPHLGATRARDWPLTVLDDEDAQRQLPLLRLLLESELHQRIFDADWRVITGYRRYYDRKADRSTEAKPAFLRSEAFGTRMARDMEEFYGGERAPLSDVTAAVYGRDNAETCGSQGGSSAVP